MDDAPATTTVTGPDAVRGEGTGFGPASFASVTVATITSGGVSVDPAGVALPATHALDITAWLEL